MLIELAIGAAAAAAATALARALWTRRGARSAAAPAAPTPPPPRTVRGPGLSPGDVLMGFGREHVLEAGSELDDGGLVLRALDVLAVRRQSVLQLDAAGEVLVLAEPTEDVPQGRVADSIAQDGRILSLVRRGRAMARAILPDRPPAAWPSGAPLTGPVEYVVLADRAGRHLVVLQAGDERLALRGDRLDRRQLDILPGG